MRYDLAVVGGGPGGYSAAISAAKEGLSVVLFEGEHLGGTCLNAGCIPTKYLLDKAAALEKIRVLEKERMIKDSGLFSYQKILKGKEKVIKKLVSGVEYLLKANGVELIRGFASVREAGKVECNGKTYEAAHMILATGSKSFRIPIPGAEYAIDSTQALELTHVPRKLVVIGGGVIGMELSSAFASFGAQVTVIEVLPRLFPAESEEAISYLTKELKKKGIRILCNTKVKNIRKINGGFCVAYEGEGNGTYDADAVLMATGRKANLQGMDVEALQLSLTDKQEIKVDAFMQTNIPGIYAIGDAAGGYQLAHAAFAEAKAAVSHILGKSEPADLEAIPRCVYTIPAFSAVGLGAEKAKEKGIQTATGTFSYSGNGMALAEGEDGVVTVVMDRDKRETIGIQIIGAGGPEMIALASMAVKTRLTLEQWEHMIVAHPSLSEMLKEAALDCFGKSIHGAVK